MAKILGLSFGRKMGNTDILVKEALFGAQEAMPQAQVRFINTLNLKIGRCIGCGSCSRAFAQGKNNDCVIHDDMQELEEAILEADCIVLGAPVYMLQPVGQYKNLLDRFCTRSCMGHISHELEMRRSGEHPGDPEVLEHRFKQRYISYISVGGATTDNWVSFGTATLQLFGLSSLMKTVGNMDVHHMGTTGSPVLDRDLMDRVHEMGRRTALAYGKRPEEVEWYGAPGVCPVCHQNLMTLSETTAVECPVCGIRGELSIEDGRVSVSFSEAERARARGTLAGQREHTDEIDGFGAICGPKLAAAAQEMPKLLDKYKRFDQSGTGW